MPSAMKLCTPRTVASKTGCAPTCSIEATESQKTSLVASTSRSASPSTLGDPEHALPAGSRLPHGVVPPNGRPHGGGEVALGEALLGEDLLDPLPDLARDGVDIGVGSHRLQVQGEDVGALLALAVHADVVEEAELVLGSRDVQDVAVAVARLANRPDPPVDVVAQQQTRHVVDQPAAGRGVVDPALPRRVDVHAAVGGPEVAQEERRPAPSAGRRPSRARTSRGCAARTGPSRRARPRSGCACHGSGGTAPAAAATSPGLRRSSSRTAVMPNRCQRPRGPWPGSPRRWLA